MRIGRKLTLVIAAVMAVSAAVLSAQSDLALVYNRPAEKWTEALPVGNGRIGAMVFGGLEDERLQINEDTLWGGGPHDYTNPGAYAHLDEIRRLIITGKVEEAEKLSATMMAEPERLMPYQPFCNLRLHFAGHDQATDYRRQLSLEDAIAETKYKIGSAEFRRQVFASYPDQVLVTRITSSQPGTVAFSVSIDSPQPQVEVEHSADDALQMTGQIQPRQSSPQHWAGSWAEPGMHFAAVLKVLVTGGSVHATEGRLDISGADSATILFSNATSFKNYRDISGDALGSAQEHLHNSLQYSYDQLLQRHLQDFRPLFSRVRLRLGQPQSAATTDQRIRDFEATDDPSLIALYFEFGRYLLISSSRPGGQPANLQGIWNQDLAPPWGSKWTTNINLEMNYWQADTGDLWETEEPLWGLIRGLQITGAETAKVQYHSQGWVLHHNTDLWRAAAPVDGPWGIWPMGEAWLANQMWDHYEFSEDRAFLEQDAYPAMKQAAEFILGTLVEAPAGTPFAGRLITNPSTSPENRYLLDGKPHSLTYAATMDLELIRELFQNCRRAAEILAIDKEFRARLDRTEQQLPPLQIGRRGQLQEWIEDYAESEPAHRHVSHLYSLYPGHDIGLNSTPKFAAAAQKTLELRGDGGTGWSTVWRMALWARLENPERAYNNLKLLIDKSTLPDMFDLCPPFQIDGNLGGPAAITEMLIQSTDHTLRILPALPRQWQSGSLEGVRVRGGGKVQIVWDKGRLVKLTLETDHASRYQITYGGASANLESKPGAPGVLDGSLHPIKP
jgi:alpha-L-fucosidase 2